MGEIVAAAVFGHQPTVMVPEELRKAMGQGRDTTLVEPGIPRLREALDACRCRHVRHLRHALVHDDRARRRRRSAHFRASTPAKRCRR